MRRVISTRTTETCEKFVTLRTVMDCTCWDEEFSEAQILDGTYARSMNSSATLRDICGVSVVDGKLVTDVLPTVQSAVDWCLAHSKCGEFSVEIAKPDVECLSIMTYPDDADAMSEFAEVRLLSVDTDSGVFDIPACVTVVTDKAFSNSSVRKVRVFGDLLFESANVFADSTVEEVQFFEGSAYDYDSSSFGDAVIVSYYTSEEVQHD